VAACHRDDRTAVPTGVKPGDWSPDTEIDVRQRVGRPGQGRAGGGVPVALHREADTDPAIPHPEPVATDACPQPKHSRRTTSMQLSVPLTTVRLCASTSVAPC